MQQWLTSYPSTEFRIFVERTEKELFSLFHSIDRDHNGKLDKEELKAAFKKAGLTVPNSKLDQFFAEVDENHDVSSLYLLKHTTC
jgi:solute carrier family 25 phosphate transporter 23/24/25/41